MAQWIILATDWAVFFLVLLLIAAAVVVRKRPHWSQSWSKVWQAPSAMVSMMLLLFFIGIATIDSVHYRPVLRDAQGVAQLNSQGKPLYEPVTLSVLDYLLTPIRTQKEISYSAPFAIHLFTKKTVELNGNVVRDYPRLTYAGQHLKKPEDHVRDVWIVNLIGFGSGLLVAVGLLSGAGVIVGLWRKQSVGAYFRSFWQSAACRASAYTWVGVCCVLLGVAYASQYYHVLGTDTTGNSILYQMIKSIRTAIVIGSLSIFISIPFAIILGLLAGFYRRWIDDLIQYVYSLISSIPTVLLMAASVLMLQVYLDKNVEAYATGIERADVRLFAICGIIGITGWVGLCRLLRAETLKLREVEYVQAAKAFGVPGWKILFHHILPNVMHIVLIVSVLEFSGLVLLEAVLSYLGIGVDPQMYSFGAMINMARIEVLRDPMIWWNVMAAFIGLLGLVLPANILADHVRRAFDPRAKTLQASWIGRRLYTKKIPYIQPVTVTRHRCG